jgi:hypothetical protein
MPDFVLLGMPDFVLIRTRDPASAPRHEDGPTFLNPLFSDLFQATGVRMEHACEADPVRFGAAARARFRPILRQYGFDRLPRTLGELCGLFDYCDRLDAITGVGVFEAEMRARWQQLTFELSARRAGMPHRAAVELYRRGETSALLAWHTEQDVLTQVGTGYRYVPGRC